MTIQHNVALKELCTMNIGGVAAHLAYIAAREDIPAACQWAQENKVGIFVLGEGSNTVFSDGSHNLLVLKMQLHGFETVTEDEASTTIKVGAGEHWDGVVAKTVAMNLSGIEGLSMIPGTAGAAPVQNIGAYGQEVAQTLVEVEAFDLQNNTFAVLTLDQCEFSYRNSTFKSAQRGRYIICSLTLKLSKLPTLTPPYYESLQKYLDANGLAEPTIAQLRESVMAIRSTRLPDPSVVPNCGSFFENPLVESAKAEELKTSYPELPTFPAGDKVKLSAGWLVEQCGLKGQNFGNIIVFPQNALVLTNPHGASFGELKGARDQIVQAVQAKFGVTLTPEPQFVE